MARDIFALLPAATPLERIWSFASHLISDNQSSLDASNIRDNLILYSNTRFLQSFEHNSDPTRYFTFEEIAEKVREEEEQVQSAIHCSYISDEEQEPETIEIRPPRGHTRSRESLGTTNSTMQPPKRRRVRRDRESSSSNDGDDRVDESSTQVSYSQRTQGRTRGGRVIPDYITLNGGY